MKVGEIEKDIPIGKVFNAQFPFGDMEVGDSFFVDAEGGDLKKLMVIVSSARRTFELNYGHKFSCRTILDPGGIRVWRIN